MAAFGKYLVVVRLNKDADGWVKDQQKVIALLKSLGLTGFKFADDMGTRQKMACVVRRSTRWSGSEPSAGSGWCGAGSRGHGRRWSRRRT